ncbi:sulfatase [uncultured Maribacter sp.]|uniref:sulfatase n=1 Tax=uncultured Maribacter sp. TaxID=431308 RepID=UPI0030ED26FA|tara:strand:- start:74463 stop:75905 length:1443 start_codon:yes stop_codon:yes gene_type:complete
MCKSLITIFIALVCGGNLSFAQKKNVLIIFVDDLRPELNSFGANYIHSPNIDSLNARGRGFNRHYVNAPSCGPSRYAFLTGQYGLEYRGESNQSLFKRAEGVNDENVSIAPSMPEWFRNNGYTTVSVGKVSHHPGGKGGDNWNDSNILEMPNAWDKHIMPVAEWESPKGAMHGLAYGKVRTPDNRNIIEVVDGNDNSYPDGHIAEEGLRQLGELAKGDKPFFLAIGLIKPHLPFGVPKKYLDRYENIQIPPALHSEKPKGKTTWHGSGEFMNYNRWDKDPREDKKFELELKKYYAACVSYADKHVGDIIQKLKKTGADKNTIIVLWGDHGWHLGEHAIWGKHSLFEESLRSPLIIYDPSMDNKGQMSNAIVESVDVFPTLCDMTTLPIPNFTEGISLKPLLDNADTQGHEAVAFISDATTIRTDQYRFTQHKNGAVELYDHQTPLAEQLNIAERNPKIIQQLRTLLLSKTADKAFIFSKK